MIARSLPSVHGIAADVAEGLTRRPKTLPPRLLYDAAGSALFERITQLPEYYLTRTERSLLEQHAAEICARAGEELDVIELGAGSAAKTRILLAALLERQASVVYSPVDVSRSALQAAHDRLQAEFDRLTVRPLVADITADLSVVLGEGHEHADARRKLVLYIGSSIGNFEPEDSISLLSRLRAALRAGDALLLGTDMVKSSAVLVPAYDDASGVTAAFNKNMLARINRELGGHFDLSLFRHRALWNPHRSRMEMYLESTVAQAVDIDLLRLRVHFTAGERIHTENSYKYTLTAVEQMLRASGFSRERTWQDDRGWFAIHLARVGEQAAA